MVSDTSENTLAHVGCSFFWPLLSWLEQGWHQREIILLLLLGIADGDQRHLFSCPVEEEHGSQLRCSHKDLPPYIAVTDAVGHHRNASPILSLQLQAKPSQQDQRGDPQHPVAGRRFQDSCSLSAHTQGQGGSWRQLSSVPGLGWGVLGSQGAITAWAGAQQGTGTPLFCLVQAGDSPGLRKRGWNAREE